MQCIKFAAKILGFLTFFYSSHNLFATSMIMTTPEQKIQQSDEICPLKVLSLRTEKRSGSVVTIATAKTIEPCYVRGTKGSIEMIWPGGEWVEDGYRYNTVVPSTPNFKVGDVAMVFLEGDGKDPYRIHSWSQGVTALEFNKKTKQYQIDSLSARRFSPAPAGKSTPSKDSQLSKTDSTDLPSNSMSLKDFKKRVQEIRKAQSKNPEKP